MKSEVEEFEEVEEIRKAVAVHPLIPFERPEKLEKKPHFNSSRYKTEYCRQYYENGFCEFGDRCLFAHSRLERNPLIRHHKYKTRICSAFHQSGYCSFGARCAFVHKKVDPFDIIKSALTVDPKLPMPENPTPSGELPQFIPSAALVRSTDREMLSEDNLMPSQFIKSNYKRLPAFTKITDT
jgi:hypothetical protein